MEEEKREPGYDPSPLGTKVKKRIVGIPAYNKERTTGSIIDGTEGYVDEIIVVDGGSADRTSKFAERTAATVIRQDNVYLGEAPALLRHFVTSFKKGLRNATGDI